MADEDKKRHGGPYDRGSADAYYGRGRIPHYYEGDSYKSRVFYENEMTAEQLAEYNAGYEEQDDRKDWGL